ncbi:MAG: Ig-like domain-containing protein [Lysobacterales bacterium]
MNARTHLAIAAVTAMMSLWSGADAATATAHWTVLGWNDLGMHCMDSDYSVFSILPPFNNVRAQVIDPSGHLVTVGNGVFLSYEAVADPDGSVNSTSIGKSGFWNYTLPLFGQTLAPDHGLAGCNMPGAGNVPQPMSLDLDRQWFGAEGVPITPYDDSGQKNPYPLMRLVVRDVLGTALAATSVVLPVSDEMDCSGCHASNSVAAARPAAGWVNDPDPARDFRLNILRLHDDRQVASPSYLSALAQLGLDPAGLYPSVQGSGLPVLCAACHTSNALPGTGLSGISALTSAMHRLHANTRDPESGLTLDSSANRSACYSCHPGSTTKCLRGAMGAAIAADGSMAMQCQSCHGNMSRVGDVNRVGWLQQPSCQNCHTGTAVQNAGLIRYTNAYTPAGELRPAVNPVFATNPDQPAPGYDLYRFSRGHGGLYCEACHGSTHAEFPSSHRNDNLQSLQVQGHAGVVSECTVCHASPANGLNGPHGLHPLGPRWVSAHGDFAEGNTDACKACHGGDYRGGVLSASQSNWTANTRYGNKNFWRGFRIGCYACHNGPNSDDPSSNHAPVVTDASLNTSAGISASMTLVATDADGNSLTLRIVSQPARGAVALTDRLATYIPEPGFSGDEEFTFAAWDGKTDSNLGRVQIHVQAALPLFQNGFED